VHEWERERQTNRYNTQQKQTTQKNRTQQTANRAKTSKNKATNVTIEHSIERMTFFSMDTFYIQSECSVT
jgi:hypothetical protein